MSVDLRYLADNQPSLCIPRVFNNITEERLRKAFCEVDLGVIDRFDVIPCKNDKGEQFKRVYIHFKKWSWSETAQVARRKLITGEDIKIVYDRPWFWKVSASKWKPKAGNRDNTSQKVDHTKARIDFGDSEDGKVSFNDRVIKKEPKIEKNRRSKYDRGDHDNRLHKKLGSSSAAEMASIPTLQRKSSANVPNIKVEFDVDVETPPKMDRSELSPLTDKSQEKDELTSLHCQKIDYGTNTTIPVLKRRKASAAKPKASEAKPKVLSLKVPCEIQEHEDGELIEEKSSNLSTIDSN